MREGDWSQALSELLDGVVAAVVRFWKEDMVQVVLAIGFFLALASPMILLILILWLLDWSGWRPAGGFYKIGVAPGDAFLSLDSYALALAMFWTKPGASDDD